MKFEHLVQINDLQAPHIQTLTRVQLWDGLVARAHTPTAFVLGLEGCLIEQAIQSDTVTTLHRVLDYGSFKLKDTVQLIALSESITTVQASSVCSESRMTIRIEEPAPGALFLRFMYEWNIGNSAAEQDPLEEFRKQAYQDADLDTVQRIREMAHQATQSPTGHRH